LFLLYFFDAIHIFLGQAWGKITLANKIKTVVPSPSKMERLAECASVCGWMLDKKLISVETSFNLPGNGREHQSLLLQAAPSRQARSGRK
jgi:hypothetical protein